ncbi:MAG: DUF302 domain-containing protein [Thiotrichales bacterium]|jgi:uncharacterized protein (DUF302 family)|nr:DUF302 domain-containing protein [Thiotrichales bacterium]MBT3613146.1 DUF302 domain-containing protein [Thiotrichales bacterium]MBT3753269.1 DUF302 domain-containing protein [Thiotrichales bacterium]MBT3837474.1 DUF302 domain-containing protein [Thiotrichales bacterium]MBT4152590.1 DUF302 domain-containing protein [Thiotrichales bacterium]
MSNLKNRAVNLVSAILFTLTLATTGKSIAAEHTALEPPTQVVDVRHSIVKMRLAPSVSIADAAEAMISKATELNLALVGQQRISNALRARGIETPHLEIFQFCNPEDAVKMVAHDIIYASYMPCRVSLVEDSSGTPWLTTLNLNMMIKQSKLPVDIYKIAVTTNTKMMTIMTAGANGEF